MKKSIRARLDQPTLITLDQDGGLPNEVLVLPVGEYKTYIGKIDITDSMLSEMVKNFEKGVPNAVPINFDHTYGEAAGWVDGLIHRTGEGLYAAVDWTSKGAEALKDKIYRFLSAEFSTNYEDSTFGEFHGNVLSGIGLTNYPMLQNIPALLSQAQDKNNPITLLFSQEGASMNLDEIRAKDAAELTDEERTFLQEHSADLNEEERTKFGVEASTPEGEPTPAAEPVKSPVPGQDEPGEGEPAPAEGKEFSQGKGQMVQLSRAELQALKTAADQGVQAMKELSQNRMRHEIVEPMLFSQTNDKGVFLPESKSRLEQFVFGLTDAQRKEFSTLVSELPKSNTLLFSEVGHGKDVEGTGSKLNQLAQAKMETARKDGREMTFSQAVEEVAKENPALIADEYSYEGAE